MAGKQFHIPDENIMDIQKKSLLYFLNNLSVQNGIKYSW